MNTNSNSGSWWRTLSRPQFLAFTVASMAWFFDCFDQQIFNLARMDAVKSLVTGEQNPKTWAAYTMTTFLVGWGTGGLWLGALGDKLGRARMLALCIFLYAIFTGLSAFSLSVWDFCGYRFLTGVGVGGVFGLSVALISDVIIGEARPKALGLFQALSTIGNVGAGLVGLGISMLVGSGALTPTWQWKTLFLVGAIPALLTGFWALTLREPASWIEARDSGKLAAARAGSYVALLGNVKWRRNALLALALCSVGIVGLWGLGNFHPDILDSVLRNKFAADGLDAKGMESQVGRAKSFAMIAQNLGGFVGMLLMAQLAQRWCRRGAFTVGFIAACAATMLVFKGLRTYEDIWWMIPLMGAAQYSLFSGFAIYLPELFPSALRSTGASLCYNGGRFVAATAPFTLALLTNYLGEGKSPIEKIEAFRTAGFWLSLVLLTALLILPFLPETKDKPLPE